MCYPKTINVNGKDKLRLDVSRIEYWGDQGAQPSDRVKNLLKGYKKQLASAPAAEAATEAKADA